VYISTALENIPLQSREKHVYGSSRLGVYSFDDAVGDGPR